MYNALLVFHWWYIKVRQYQLSWKIIGQRDNELNALFRRLAMISMFCQSWSMEVIHSQQRYIKFSMDAYPPVRTRSICKLNVRLTYDLQVDSLLIKSLLYLRLRWDDREYSVCYKLWPQFQKNIGSILYIIMSFTIMMTNRYFILSSVDGAL